MSSIERHGKEWWFKRFREQMEGVVSNLRGLVETVKEIEERGWIGELRKEYPLLDSLRRIAHHQTAPELFETCFIDRPYLLQKACSLPLPDQRHLAENKPLKVMLRNGDSRMVPPFDMSKQEIDQVIHRGRFRSEAEQVGYIISKDKPKPRQDDDLEITVDKKHKVIRIGPVALTRRRLLDLLSQLE